METYIIDDFKRIVDFQDKVNRIRNEIRVKVAYAEKYHHLTPHYRILIELNYRCRNILDSYFSRL